MAAKPKTVIFYGVVSGETEKVAEFFPRLEQAAPMIAKVREDEPELAEKLRVKEDRPRRRVRLPDVDLFAIAEAGVTDDVGVVLEVDVSEISPAAAFDVVVHPVAAVDRVVIGARVDDV